MERHEIERKDFPTARRGYDPAAVDRHLGRIADTVEELTHGRPASSASLAVAAADRVRGIVEAAESSASELLSEAETDARKVRDQAESDAAAHVARVEEAVAGLLTRADELERELAALADQHRSNVESVVESLRREAGALSSQLGELRTDLAAVSIEDVGMVRAPGAEGRRAGEPLDLEGESEEGERGEEGERAELEQEAEPVGGVLATGEGADATSAEGEFAGEERTAEAGEQTGEEPSAAAGPSAAGPGDEAAQASAARPEPAVAHAEPTDEDEEPPAGPFASMQESPAEAAFEAAPPARPARPGDGHEGARLIALNMALNGTPREEVARYLHENFELDDADAILDEVYARVG